jgi:hypothetical protein
MSAFSLALRILKWLKAGYKYLLVGKAIWLMKWRRWTAFAVEKYRMKGFTYTVFGAACALALTVTSASDVIVCNREGECRHVKEKHPYRGEWGLMVHPDN